MSPSYSYCTAAASHEPYAQPRALLLHYFRLRIHFIDQRPVAFFNSAPPNFESVSHGSGGGRKFLRNDQYAFQLFEARQVLVRFFNNTFIERLHSGMRNQYFSGGKVNLICARPVFENREVGRDQHGGKFSPVPNHDRRPNQRIELQRIFDRLRSNELSTRSLDQILLAIGNRKISIAV